MGIFQKTALHIAVEHGNEFATKFLLNNGADITQKDGFGFDVYSKSELRGNYNFFRIFDYYTKNRKERKLINYDEKRYCGPFKLEDLESGLSEYRPTHSLEFHHHQNTLERANIMDFAFYFFSGIPYHPSNLKNNYNLGSYNGEFLRTRHDDSYFVRDI